MNTITKTINDNLNKILKGDKKLKSQVDDFKKEMKHFSNFTIKNNDISQIKEMKYINELEVYSIEEREKWGKSSGFLPIIKSPNKKKISIIESQDEINKVVKQLNDKNREIREKIYIENIDSLKEISEFVVRRLFIEYTIKIINEVNFEEKDEIKTFCYNMQERISEIKSDEDNWILGDRYIQNFIKYLRENARLNSKAICNAILYIVNNKFNDITVELLSDINRYVNVKENENLYKINSLIDELIMDYIEYRSDIDIDIVKDKFESVKVYKDILSFLGYDEINLNSGDRLDLEKCATIDIEYTDDIEKDFLISHVYKKGFAKDDKVIRRTLVKVYRFKMD